MEIEHLTFRALTVSVVEKRMHPPLCPLFASRVWIMDFRKLRRPGRAPTIGRVADLCAVPRRAPCGAGGRWGADCTARQRCCDLYVQTVL